MGFNQLLIISTILMSLGFLVLSGAVMNYAVNQNIAVDSEFQETFDKYQETQDNFEETQDIIQGGDINEAGFDQAIYKNVIVAGKQAQQQGNIFIIFLSQVNKYIPIQTQILTMLGTIIFVLILFAFLNMITKQTP